jgi:hypothetical protein
VPLKWRTDDPCGKIGNADQTRYPNNISIMFRGFFLRARSAITNDTGSLGAPLILADYKYKCHALPYLLTCQLPNKLSVHGGNGNRLYRRQ